MGKGKGPLTYPDLAEVLEVVPKIHGHICTASYLGSRMALRAVKDLDIKRKKDLCAAVEILTCAADGIQAATCCSFGSGRLTFLDHGKFSAILSNRMTGEAVRVRPVPEVDAEHIEYGKQLEKFYRMQGQGASMEELKAERKRLKVIEDALIEKWGGMSDDNLLICTRVKVDPKDLMYPLENQYIPEPTKCPGCGELTERSRMIEGPDGTSCKACAGLFKIEEL
jgi:formylmethanofuran dehydrogenase subunit E